MSFQKKKTVVQFSDSSSESDDEHNGGRSMAAEMALAAKKLREKNPHGEQGRAVMPRAHPLDRPTVAAAGRSSKAAGPPRSPAQERVQPTDEGSYPKGKRMDLFADTSSSSEAEEQAEPKAAPTIASAKPTNPSKKKEGTDGKGGSGGVADAEGSSRGSSEEHRAGDGDEEDDDNDESTGLRINKKYAAKYEEVKRKQELQRLTEKYGKQLDSIKKGLKSAKKPKRKGDGDDGAEGDSDTVDQSEDGYSSDATSSEGEPEDDDAVLLTEENEIAFAQALLAVRKAAAKASEANSSGAAPDAEESEPYLKQRYFPPVEEQIKHNTEVYEQALKRKSQAKKKFTLKEEYQRAVHRTAAVGEEDEAAEEEEPADNGSGLRKLKPQTAEERALRKAFLDSVADSTEAFSVSKKPTAGEQTEASAGRSDEQRARELEEQRRKLMEEAFNIGAESSTGQKAQRPASSKVNEDEVFIRQFFLNDLWRGGGGDSDSDDDGGDDEGGANYAKTLAELAQAEEDEAFYRDADVWEREFQEKKYRHEEEAEAAQIQTFPRPIGEAAAGLLRKTSDTRKDARRRRKERLEAARQQQVEELKRLKHLKRQEIEEQRALIAAVAGIASKRSQGAAAGGKGSPNADELAKPTWSDDEGGDEDAALKKLKAVWSDKDLNAPFDPEEFDKKMAQLFDDNYYAEENVNEDEIAYMEAELDNTGEEEEGADLGRRALKEKEVDDDEEDDDDGEELSSDEGGDEEKSRTKSARGRGVFTALAEEPDLFKVSSLEEAKQLALSAAQQRQQGNGAHGKRHGEDGDGLFFTDPFSINSGDGDSKSGARRTAGSTVAKSSALADDDDLALLYPSASLHHLEEAAFQHRQELDRLLEEHKKSAAAGRSNPEEPGRGEGSGRHIGGGEAADDDGDDSEEAVLKRLQAELKRKEEEYYQLHHEGTIAGGEIKTRFRYREVEPEDFTLSIEEILARDDRQLNMIAPMNCYAAYLDKASNERDRRRIERRRAKGFREIETDRKSRRYGEVAKTVLLNPEEMTTEEGEALTQRLRKRLREEGVEERTYTRNTGNDGGGGGGGGARRPFFPHGRGGGRGRGDGARGRGRGGSFERGGRGGSFERGGRGGSFERGGRGGSFERGGRGGGRARGVTFAYRGGRGGRGN